jgi:hypothetical protein
MPRALLSFLDASSRREIEDVRSAAEVILRHPVDHKFTGQLSKRWN